MLTVRVTCSSEKHQKFGKRVASKRREEIKSLGKSIRKLADQELEYLKELYKEHQVFFQEPEPDAVPVKVETFFDE
jgi:hypothetical protein